MGRTPKISTAILALGLAFTAAGCTTPVVTSGLRPLDPEVRHGFSRVDSYRPTLRWESFPRKQDLGADPEGRLEGIKDVGYDLKIFKEEAGRPGRLVYRRDGLSEPAHKLEQSLGSATKYFWTVRARFTVDGKRRVTEWGIILPPRAKETPRRSPRIPNRNFYRIETH